MKHLLLSIMALLFVSATTANAASISCDGMNVPAQNEMAMELPCHPAADDADMSCDGCTCLHVVPYAQTAMDSLLPEIPVKAHDIVWREQDNSNPWEELFQPPI